MMERYSEYKDSGVKWLGEIPSHWEVVPIKHSYKFTVGWTPPTGRNDLFEGINLWANISDLGDKVIRTTTNHISDSAVRQSGRSISPKGSLLYSFKLSVGTVSFCGADMYTNEAIATFLKGKNSLEFLYYAAPIFIIKNANTNIYGAPILNQDLIKNALVLLPPLSEQDAIVRYLDSATSEIDKAIAMQQKMIDLLNERKQIIIQNAVTKGLDENVEMKESGVEWIGRIPKHWEVLKLKRCAIIKTGTTPPTSNLKYFENGDIPWFTPGDINDMNLHLSSKTITKKAIEDNVGRLFPAKSIYFVGIGATVGKVASCDFEASSNQQINAIMCNDRLDYKFATYCLLMEQRIIRETTNFVTLPILNQSSTGLINIVVPPKSEQQQIVTYLDSEMQRFDSAITNCQRQITLLQERKQIIINEVVTGKVRVL